MIQYFRVTRDVTLGAIYYAVATYGVVKALSGLIGLLALILLG